MADLHQSQLLLVLEVAETHFGVKSEFVREVQRAVSLSSVPEAGPHILGAMNLRGQMVLVLDLRAAMGAALKPLMPTDHFVVLSCGDEMLAIRVDRARDLVQVDENCTMSSAPIQTNHHLVGQVARVAEQFIHVIDPARLSALALAARQS